MFVCQVCISFALHRGMVVIPKTVNPVRVTENLKSTELKLDAEDMRRLRELDRSLRYVKVHTHNYTNCTVLYVFHS